MVLSRAFWFAVASLCCTFSAVDCNCLPGLFKGDALAEVNKLLVKSTESGYLPDNIDAARNILAMKDELRDDVKDLLRRFVALQPIVDQLKTGKFECSFENLALMRDINKSMYDNSMKNFCASRSERRFNKMIIEFQQVIGSDCFTQLSHHYVNVLSQLQYASLVKVLRLNAFKFLVQSKYVGDLPDKLRSLERAVFGKHKKKLTDLDSDSQMKWAKVLAKMHLNKYGTGRVGFVDPVTRTWRLTREHLAEKYDKMVTKSCDYVENGNEELATILEKTLELVKSVKLTAHMMKRQSDYYFVEVAAGYRVCKDLKNVDQDKIIDAALKYVSCCEDQYLPSIEKRQYTFYKRGATYPNVYTI